MIMRKHLVGRNGLVQKKKKKQKMKHDEIQTVSWELWGKVSLRLVIVASLTNFLIQYVCGVQVGDQTTCSGEPQSAEE